ncbi:MAG: hypothetical protein IJ087_17270 [Eggerthellaceae bacterium]|nr:hypothetical protein [Eggerthellaceae bacterium]
MIDRTLIFLIALALIFVALVVGFVAGIVMTLTGSNGSGLTWSCGMPLMVMLMGAANSRKRK